MLAHRPHACNVGGKVGTAHLHLDGAKAFAEIVVSLSQQRLDRRVKVDAAGVAGHAGIKAAEQAEQRQIGAPRRRSHSAMSSADSASTAAPPRPP